MVQVTRGKTFVPNETNIDDDDMNSAALPSVTIQNADFGISGDATAVATWQKVATIEASDLTDGDASETETIIDDMPARTIIHGFRYRLITAFDGGATSGLTIEIGISGDVAKYMTAQEIHLDATEVVDGVGVDLASTGIQESGTATTDIIATFTATGGFMNAIDTGKIDIYALTAQLPAHSAA